MRNERDFYPTPHNAFDGILRYIPRDVAVWEPASGDGRLVKWMIDACCLAGGDDLKNGYDYLKDTAHHSCIVTNPPFSKAFEFCKHARDYSVETFLLLRLNFLASQMRASWFKFNEPNALFILSKRPSFTKDKKTDMTDYAWYYWGERYTGIHHI